MMFFFNMIDDNIFSILSLLHSSTFIGSRVGVLVSIFVGVSTWGWVEAIAHPLTVSAPSDPVGPELHRDIQPLVKILCSTIPPKDIREVVPAALRDLIPDPNKRFRISIVEGWLQLCGFVILRLSIGRRSYLLVLRVGYSLGIVLDNRLVGSVVWAESNVIFVSLECDRLRNR